MPFWVEENDAGIKNHFFIFGFQKGKLHPIWQSSNLENPNCEIQVADVDGDRKDDLVVVEGDYRDWPDCRGRHLAIWKWNGWGFSNEWRSVAGKYDHLAVEQVQGKAVITANRY